MYPSLMRAGAHGAPAANCRVANVGPTMGYSIIFHTDGHSEYGKKIYGPSFQRSTSPGGLSEKTTDGHFEDGRQLVVGQLRRQVLMQRQALGRIF